MTAPAPSDTLLGVTGEAQARAARATRRDYCRGCSSTTLHPFAGWATTDGRENTIRPRAYYRTCSGCGLLVLVLDDVTDLEGLARAVLDKYLRSRGGASTPVSKPVGPAPLDWDACLNYLVDEGWKLYERSWNPAYGDGRVTFRGYATNKMQHKLYSWIEDETGDASGRSKGRVHPKAHAPSVCRSLDQLLEQRDLDDGAALDRRTDDRDPLAEALTGGAGDIADDYSPDLAWALAQGSRA